MTKIGGYVNMYISDQWVECHNCKEYVNVASIEELENISPSDMGIHLYCNPCPNCGIVNVYEYVANARYSKQMTQVATNEHFEQTGDKRGSVDFYETGKTVWVFANEEDEEE